MSDQDVTESRPRTAWWGTCEDCSASVVVYPSPDRAEDIPDQEEWEDYFSDCYVCGNGRIDWGGADPAEKILRTVTW